MPCAFPQAGDRAASTCVRRDEQCGLDPGTGKMWLPATHSGCPGARLEWLETALRKRCLSWRRPRGLGSRAWHRTWSVSGWPWQDRTGLQQLVNTALTSAQRLGERDGITVLRWQDLSGARLVMGVRDGKLLDLLPSFAGTPGVRLASIRAANDDVAIADVVDEQGEQLTMLALELEQRRFLSRVGPAAGRCPWWRSGSTSPCMLTLTRSATRTPASSLLLEDDTDDPPMIVGRAGPGPASAYGGGVTHLVRRLRGILLRLRPTPASTAPCCMPSGARWRRPATNSSSRGFAPWASSSTCACLVPSGRTGTRAGQRHRWNGVRGCVPAVNRAIRHQLNTPLNRVH